jgi:hypothetical protein
MAIMQESSRERLQRGNVGTSQAFHVFLQSSILELCRPRDVVKYINFRHRQFSGTGAGTLQFLFLDNDFESAPLRDSFDVL